MFKRIIQYAATTITPIDRVKSFFAGSSGKIKVGFCSIFPPFVNGVAAANYYMLKELGKRTDIELWIIPVKNKFDKKLFFDIPLNFTTVSDSKLDVVVFFGLGNQFESYRKKTRCKTIAWQTIHGYDTYPEEEIAILNQVKRADKVCALTKWAENWYRRKINNVLYLPHGVDTSLFFPHEREDTFTCIFVSRTHYYKGIAAFLDVLKILFKKDTDILARIVAPVDKNSPFLNEISETLDELKKKYPARLKINTGWVDYKDMPAQYQNADVLVFPSNNEGFGLPLIEAMSSGIPCICLDHQPMSEIVINGETGFCIPSITDISQYHGFNFPDPVCIADKILLLKNNKTLRDKLGKNARKRVKIEYDLRTVIDKLIDECKSLSQKH